MVLDFAKDVNELMRDSPMDTNRIKENLSWLNSLLCDRKREVKTLEESILLLEAVLERQRR